MGYREYKSNPQLCKGCEVRARCTNSANAVKVVVRHVWERAKERVDARRLTEWGKRICARRKETVERSFADANQLHGHRYARMRGLRKMAAQCLLAAAAQNIKKIALLPAPCGRFYVASGAPIRWCSRSLPISRAGSNASPGAVQTAQSHQNEPHVCENMGLVSSLNPAQGGGFFMGLSRRNRCAVALHDLIVLAMN